MKAQDIMKVMDMAKRAREIGEVFNPMFVAPPGVGKSQIVQQWAKLNNYRVIDKRAAMMESVDLLGYPSVTVVDGKQRTVHNPPDFIPTTPGEKVVLFFDEINRANTSVLNCMMQLLTDRCIDKAVLSEETIIVACVNPENGDNDVTSMDLALKDRFEIFEVEYDKKTFVEHIEDANWDSAVLLYVSSGTWQYKLPEEISGNDGSKYISPRTLSKLNAARKVGIPSELELTTYESILGKFRGKEFFSFVHKEQPVVYEDLIKNKKDALKRLAKFSNPKDYKSGHIAVTIKSLIDNSALLKNEDDLLIAVCLALPADQVMPLLRELEFKLNKELLRYLSAKESKLGLYLKDVLKKEDKSA